jgi:hypothetical protein
VFFQAPVNPRKTRKEAPVLLLVPLWVLALAKSGLGLIPRISRSALRKTRRPLPLDRRHSDEL